VDLEAILRTFERTFTMNNIWTRRFGAAAGAIYILLSLLRGDSDDGPGVHASPAQLQAWIDNYSTITTERFLIGCLEVVGLLFFLIFVAYLWSVLHRAEGEAGYLSTAVLGAGILSVAIKAASLAAIVVAYVWAKDGVDPKMIWDMGYVTMVLTLAANGLLVAVVAAIGIPTRAVPRLVSWGAVPTSVALFANIAFDQHTGFLPAMLLFMLWTLASSIALAWRAGADASSPARSSRREPVLAR
jgi:hypothetical protein